MEDLGGRKIDIHPLPINIIKLQRFDFNKINLEDIVFLNWLIANASYFNFKEFYKSEKYIFNSTGIKRTKLKTCRKKFIDMGFLSVIVKGMPAIHYYKFNTSLFLNCLGLIYKNENTESQKKLYKIYFRKKRIDYSLTQDEQKELMKIYKELKGIYTTICNQRKFSNSCNTVINDKGLKLLNAIFYDFEKKDIINSFTNYSHAIVNGKIKPNYLFNYFLLLNKYTGEFTTIEYYLEVYQKRH